MSHRHDNEGPVRRAIVELAHDRPELRKHLLPLVRQAGVRFRAMPGDVPRDTAVANVHASKYKKALFRFLHYIKRNPLVRNSGEELDEIELVTGLSSRQVTAMIKKHLGDLATLIDRQVEYFGGSYGASGNPPGPFTQSLQPGGYQKGFLAFRK